jgi:hypothetical protein
MSQISERLQHVGSAQGVDFVGFQRAKIRITNQRLSRKVENKIRTASKDGFPYFHGIAEIAEFVPKSIFKL